MTLAAVDYTVVLTAGITGLTALVSGGIGYLAARLQAGALGAQAAAETERVREQLERDDRRVRAASYTALLNEDRRLFARLLEAESLPAAFDEWLKELYNHFNVAILMGDAAVAAAAVRFQNTVLEFRSKTLDAFAGKRSFAPDELKAMMNRWEAARRPLIDAMRSDVAPDREPISWAGTGLDPAE